MLSQPLASTDDRRLATDLAEARAGDLDALERLLVRAGPAVRAALDINPKWRPVLDVDDVMQVTYMEAFARFDQFVGDTAAALTVWLRQIARNNLRDAIRALERDKRPAPERRIVAGPAEDSYTALAALLGVTSTTPSRVAAASEARTLIDNALRAMPDRYALALRLMDLEGRSGPEAAAALGCSRVTAFLLRARARDRLRELLGSPSRVLGDRG